MFDDTFLATLDARQSRTLADALERRALVLRQRADMLDPPVDVRAAARARLDRARRCARLVSGYIVSGLTVDAAVDRVAGRFAMPAAQLLQIWKNLEGWRPGVVRRRGERMLRLQRSGWTLASIARRFGVCVATVRNGIALARARRDDRAAAAVLIAPEPASRPAVVGHA